MKLIEFTMILPGYNEEEAVANTVQKSYDALSRSFKEFEIILINDCSTDRTGEEAEKVARIYPEVRVCHNKKNIGQAMSLIEGFHKAKGEIVMHNAFDLPFDPIDIGKIKEAMSDGTDVVIVEREDRANYSVYRKIISLTNVMLLRILFQCSFSDYNFVQAYRRRVLDDISIKTKAVGSLTPELIIRSYSSGFSIKSIKLPYHERKTGKSSIKAKHVFDSLMDTFRLWLWLKSSN